MVWMDPDGVRQLSSSLGQVRESLVPTGTTVPETAAGMGDPAATAAATRLAQACETMMVTLAGEVDSLARGAQRAATAWEVTEHRNTAAMTSSLRGSATQGSRGDSADAGR